MTKNQKHELVFWPNPILLHELDLVLPPMFGSNELKDLVAEMFHIMHKYGGIGLAANQIGVNYRILVADISYLENAKELGFTQPKVFINPEIIETYGTSELEEGCLSFPTVTATIKRHDLVTVKALDIDGKQFLEEASGLYAHVLQHEIEHLNGKSIYDHMSALRRDIAKRKMKKYGQKM